MNAIADNTYTYDDFNRLTSWSLEGQQQDAWTYDRVGNWTMNGWTADPKADMLTASPGSQTYTYTPRGSLKEVYANQQQAHTFGYDAEGLLTAKADMQQSLLTQMGWDHAGRRLELYKVGGDTWRFIYDPTASVPAVLVEDLNGTPQAFYVREPDGRLLARDSGDALQYYFFDLLGSTVLMAPATEGNPTDRFYYTPWGQTVTTGARASTVATTSNPYRYVGSLGYYTHHQDANLADWMQLGVRFYDPELGRFERRDPLDAVTSDYTYVQASPQGLVDPSGLFGSRDFVYRYLHGGGDIDLAAVGLLSAFQGAPSVRQAVTAFESNLRKTVEETAAKACRGKRDKQVIFPLNYGDTTYTDVQYALGLALFSVGDSTFFRHASCGVTVDCCRKCYSFVCLADYGIRDWFRDPFGWGFEIGTPYRITANWSHVLRGTTCK